MGAIWRCCFARLQDAAALHPGSFCGEVLANVGLEFGFLEYADAQIG
jgi:hypothetical protein